MGAALAALAAVDVTWRQQRRRWGRVRSVVWGPGRHTHTPGSFILRSSVGAVLMIHPAPRCTQPHTLLHLHARTLPVLPPHTPPLLPSLVQVAEQIPGRVESADVTRVLEDGYWPSYNIPYFRSIWEESGYQVCAGARRDRLSPAPLLHV